MPLTLDQIRRTTEAGELPTDAAATVLADATRYILAAGAITLDQAFGVNVPSGGGARPIYRAGALAGSTQ